MDSRNLQKQWERGAWWAQRGMRGARNQDTNDLQCNDTYRAMGSQWNVWNCGMIRSGLRLREISPAATWQSEREKLEAWRSSPGEKWELSYIVAWKMESSKTYLKTERRKQSKRFTWLAMIGEKRKDKAHTLDSDLGRCRCRLLKSNTGSFGNCL